MAMVVLTAGASLYAGDAKQFQDKHKAAGVQCASCHGNNTKAIIPNQNCLACHDSYQKLGEQTKDMHINPHKSPHFMDLECTSCHASHTAIKNFCQDCHGPIARKR